MSTPSGNSTSRSRRLFSLAPSTLSAPLGVRRRSGTSMRARPGEVRAGQRLRRSSRGVAGVPACTMRPPCDAGAGAEVDHVVGAADRLLVVLDHDDGVADVAQADERLEQALVVARVQADRGLVEDVDDAGELGADLASRAGCAATRRPRATVPRGRARGSRGRRRPGSRGGRGSPSAARRRSSAAAPVEREAARRTRARRRR